ncbi:MAG: FTR1 family protein, partial [Candidatus Tectimicrobiota bacterium]
MTPLIAAGLITFREGLEASLIVGIVLGYLRKIGRSDRRGYVWSGVLAALLLSLVIAVGLQFLGARLEGDAEATFEGATMFLAVGVLTYMVFWMRYQARFVKVALERDIEMAVS